MLNLGYDRFLPHPLQFINLLATDLFFQILATLYLKCNTETKQGSIMK
jgi:hypothetical protein